MSEPNKLTKLERKDFCFFEKRMKMNRLSESILASFFSSIAIFFGKVEEKTNECKIEKKKKKILLAFFSIFFLGNFNLISDENFLHINSLYFCSQFLGHV